MSVIERIDRIPLYHQLAEPFANGQGFLGHREYLLVRVVSSDGAVGYGECIGPVAGTDQVIERVIAPALTGTDPLRGPTTLRGVTDLLRRRYKSYVPYGAVGGVEMALWDLRGRLLDTPVCELLGGRFHDAAPAYVTGHYFRAGLGLDDQIATIAAEAHGHLENGFGRVKLKLGLDGIGLGRDADLRLLTELRSSLPADVALMADANCAYDLMQARRVGRCAEELGYEWLEEPLAADDLAGYAALTRELRIPVAAGESWGDAAVFSAAGALHAVDLLQPDIVAAGGLEAVRRISVLAADRGIACQPHVWGTSLAMAAGLHVLASRPERPLFEYDQSPNPIRDGMLGDQLALRPDGTVQVPTGAGLGVDIDPDVLERFRDRR